MKTAFLTLFISLLFSFSAPEKSFSGTFNIKLESTKNKGVVMLSECFVNNAKLLVLTYASNTPDKKRKMLVNGDEKTMYYLDDDKKTAMKISLETMAQAGNMEAPQITETSEYKTIDGYKCRKTNEINKTSTSEIWTTEDINVNFSKVANAFAYLSKKKGGSLGPNYGLKGFPIEIITTENGDGFVSTIHYTDIKAGPVDESIFDLTGYKVTDVMAGGR